MSDRDGLCFFSVVRYVADPRRAEPRNIGVLLVCPDRGYAGARFLPSRTGLSPASRRFQHIQALIRGYEIDMPGDPGPLFASLPSRWTSDDLANLHRESTNLIQFTHPDPVLGDPEEELQRLYRERVQPRGAARGRGSPWTASRTAEVFRGVFARRHKTMAIDETGKIPLNDGTYNFDLTIRNGKPLFVVETVSFRLQNLTRVEHVAGWFAHVWPHVAAETSAEGILLAERDASSAEAESYYRRIERWAKEAKIAVKDAQNAQQLAEAIVEQVPSFGGGHQTTSF